MGASNAVQPEVPMENYRAMIRAWKEFGQYEMEKKSMPNRHTSRMQAPLGSAPDPQHVAMKGKT